MMTKEMIFSRGFKRHTNLKHVLEEVTPKEQKNILITIDKFMNIYGEKIKKYADSCNEDSC